MKNINNNCQFLEIQETGIDSRCTQRTTKFTERNEVYAIIGVFIFLRQ